LRENLFNFTFKSSKTEYMIQACNVVESFHIR